MPFLRDLLTSTNATNQLIGVIRLRQLGLLARPALPDLVAIVGDEKTAQHTAHAACRALGEFGAEARNAVPALKARLAGEAKINSRINLAKTLLQIDAHQTEAMDVILEQARTPGSPVRHYAISSLGNIGPNAEAAIPILLDALREDHDQIWWSAATALVKIGETNRALSAVGERLRQGNAQNRLNAAMFIVHYDPAHTLAVSNLVEFTRDGGWGHIAIRTLGELRPIPEQAVQALREIAGNKTNALRPEAERLLRRFPVEDDRRQETR